MTAAVIALGLVTVLLSVVVVSLLRSHADILRALHDSGIREGGHQHELAVGGAQERPEIPDEGGALGVIALDIIGEAPNGDALSISLESSPRTLLAFLSSGCLTCRDLWTSIDDEATAALRSLGARLVVVGKSSAEESPAAILGLQPATAPTVLSSTAWAHFGVPVSPYFVLVDGKQRRVIGEGAGRSWAQVQRLLEQSLADTGDTPSGDERTDRRSFLTGRDRERRADRALLDAGILPGDPSLRPELPAEPEVDRRG